MGNREWKEAFSLRISPPLPRGREPSWSGWSRRGCLPGNFCFPSSSTFAPGVGRGGGRIFAAALFLMKNRLPEQIRLVSVLLPFAALSTVTELHRSARCRMEELEMASRFSLKTLLLARLTLLGLGNLLLLCALFPLMTGWGQLPLAETGFYLLCPYCLTSLLCLMITRRFRGVSRCTCARGWRQR